MTSKQEGTDAAVRLRAAAQLPDQHRGGKSRHVEAGRHLMRRTSRDVAVRPGNTVGFAIQIRDPGSNQGQGRSSTVILA